MRFELVEIQSALAIPAVYVTHDQSEAMVMSQTVIVMERGDIAQSGPPEQIYRRPRSRFVADFIGLSNFIEGKVVGRAGDDHWLVRSTLGDLVCSGDEPVAEGQDVVLAIRPESIRLANEASGLSNAFRVSMKSRYFLGPHTEYFVEAGESRLRVQTSDPIGASVGSELFAWVSPDHCHILPEEAVAVAAGESAVRAKQLQEV
jgi:iron(III) transport system ATP-binding protein